MKRLPSSSNPAELMQNSVSWLLFFSGSFVLLLVAYFQAVFNGGGMIDEFTNLEPPPSQTQQPQQHARPPPDSYPGTIDEFTNLEPPPSQTQQPQQHARPPPDSYPGTIDEFTNLEPPPSQTQQPQQHARPPPDSYPGTIDEFTNLEPPPSQTQQPQQHARPPPDSYPGTIDEFTKLEPTRSQTQPPQPHLRLPPDSYPFIRALRTAENKSDPCGGRYIYVHDLPPKFNQDIVNDCKSISHWTDMCKFIRNGGLGPPLKNEKRVFSNSRMYDTNQFVLDIIFNNRMKQYECLTQDSSIAAAIYVPFFAGFDLSRHLWFHNISDRDALSLALVDWLVQKPEWKIMGGKDHFIVGGRVTWAFRRSGDRESDWGSKLFNLPAVKNMSILLVESSPWSFNDFAIPYPTYFHPKKDADVFKWQNRMRKLKRPWLFSFAGAPRPSYTHLIRGQIIEQCKISKLCHLLECVSGETKKCYSPMNVMRMFQSSQFCLQPAGDSFTRRSSFDSMLAGCIPVFFHPATAYTQYTWHLPRNYSKYSVFISEDDIRKKNVSIEERLRQISPKQVKIMRKEVIRLIPRLIYADPRSKLETLKDAFDVTVQAVIDRVTKLRKSIIEGHEVPNAPEHLAWKYALLEDGQQESTTLLEASDWFLKPVFLTVRPLEGSCSTLNVLESVYLTQIS
ncbi:hypothetical protein NE237_011559 [Protea cynaroides]|uniref:Exostosin GT47 domain-containing protein n=1 Tax=Protea cynaroides TaxID=273540 RepID=A0A9Q0GXB1_9MAGN|nr:hypothetical protein NE237_011559 [Protea cynaroides]